MPSRLDVVKCFYMMRSLIGSMYIFPVHAIGSYACISLLHTSRVQKHRFRIPSRALRLRTSLRLFTGAHFLYTTSESDEAVNLLVFTAVCLSS